MMLSCKESASLDPITLGTEELLQHVHVYACVPGSKFITRSNQRKMIKIASALGVKLLSRAGLIMSLKESNK